MPATSFRRLAEPQLRNASQSEVISACGRHSRPIEVEAGAALREQYYAPASQVTRRGRHLRRCTPGVVVVNSFAKPPYGGKRTRPLRRYASHMGEQ